MKLYCVLTLSMILMPLTVSAGRQEAMPAFCEGDSMCALHYNHAIESARDEKTEQAIEEFQATYDRKQFPPLLFNIARLHHRSGKVVDAIHYYNLYLNSPPADDEKQREKARSYLGQAVRSPQVPSQSIPLGSTPIYKRWWFWTALGGAVVVGGLAIGLGVTFGQNSVPSNWPRQSY